MNPHKLIVTIPADITDAPAGLFVNMFHRWIQQQSVPDHLLIDVADYAHVANGPGTILVCLEANIHITAAGLMYVRKRPFADRPTPEESVSRCVTTALELAEKMEADPAVAGHFRRLPGGFRVQFNDRLNTPNTAAKAAEVLPAVSAGVRRIFPGSVVRTDRSRNSPEQLLEVTVTVDQG